MQLLKRCIAWVSRKYKYLSSCYKAYSYRINFIDYYTLFDPRMCAVLSAVKLTKTEIQSTSAGLTMDQCGDIASR